MLLNIDIGEVSLIYWIFNTRKFPWTRFLKIIPASSEHNLTLMSYALTNHTVFQARPIRTIFSPCLSAKTPVSLP